MFPFAHSVGAKWAAAVGMRGVRSSLLFVAAALAVVGAVWLAYAPSMRAPFYFDDTRIIADDASIRWDEVSWHRLAQTLEHAALPNRPVANVSFALNHRFAGLETSSYHWTNLVVHLLTGGVLMWLCVLIAGAAGASRRITLTAAFLASALFLLHPLNVQAVTYVVQRMASLAALFGLLALALYVDARRASARSVRLRAASFVGAAVSWLLALGSKENALTVIPVALLYEFCFHGAAWRRTLAVAWGKGIVHKAVLVAVPVVVFVGAAWIADSALHWGTFSERDFTGAERVLSQARAQFFYLGLLFYPSPSRLSLEHEFAVSHSLVDPLATLPAVVAVAGVTIACLVLAWRGRSARYVWPVLAYLTFHSVEAAPLSLELVFEHRMYLPMAALAVLVACGVVDLAPRWRRLALVSGIAMACVLSLVTYRRNLVWADEMVFWEDVVAKSPGLSRPHVALGDLYARHERFADAAREFEIALRIRPSAKAHYNLGNVLFLHLGRPEEAIVHLRAAVELSPRYASPRTMLGLIAERSGAHAKAQTEFEAAARISPNDPTVRENLGRIYLHQGMLDAAIEELEAACRFGPQSAHAHNNLAIAYARGGRPDEAIREFRTALSLEPGNHAARVNLERLLAAGQGGAGAMSEETRQ